MRAWLRDRPWLWVLALCAMLLAGAVAFLAIAERNRPEPAAAAGPPGLGR